MVKQNYLQNATISDLFAISKLSACAKSKEIYIYEKEDLSKLIGFKKAEELRQLFLKNKIKVKQITNLPSLPKFSKNDKFINTCMTFRYVPKQVYRIENEVLIFYDIVAIYNIKPFPKLLIIKDKNYSTNQKHLFEILWQEGLPPKLIQQILSN